MGQEACNQWAGGLSPVGQEAYGRRGRRPVTSGAGGLWPEGQEACGWRGSRPNLWDPVSPCRCFSRSDHLALHMKRHL